MTLIDLRPSPESVAALVPPPSAAAFVAVHRPAPLNRRETGEPADEHALLELLSAPGVVTVVGAEGAGKSHLLRWLELHLAGGREVVRVEPATELPAPQPAGLSDALRAKAEAARAECDAAVGKGEPPDPKARSIAEIHAPGLLLLLEGPLRDEFPSPGPDGQYAPADFEFRAVASHKIADPKLMRYVQKLKTNALGERAAAAELLNELRAAPPAPAPDVVYLVDGLPQSEETRRAVLADGVRAVLAVKPEESDGLPGTVFDLSAFAPGALPELAGAYLNAARIGADQLEAWFEAAGRNPDARPPIADEIDLSEADRAVLESFGRDGFGHPLFPLRLESLPGESLTPSEFLAAFLPAALGVPHESDLPVPAAGPEVVPVAPESEMATVEVEVRPLAPDGWRRELHALLSALLDMEADRVAALRRLSTGLLAETAPEPDAEVEAFRAAAESPDGAPLALVTPAVQAWLRATGRVEKYRVRP